MTRWRYAWHAAVRRMASAVVRSLRANVRGPGGWLQNLDGYLGIQSVGGNVLIFRNPQLCSICIYPVDEYPWESITAGSVTVSQNGEDCPNVCASSPCLNGATCSLSNFTYYVCVCAGGFTGERCETDIDECLSNPCFNGGTCVDGVASFTCVCTDAWTGPTCENNVDPCASDPCHNGATCIAGEGATFTCTCVAGFTGEQCETEIDECASSPCLNGGTCIDQIGRFVCTCAPGFTGTQCQLPVVACELNPCENGGTCIETESGYTCECAARGGGNALVAFVWGGENCTLPACGPLGDEFDLVVDSQEKVNLLEPQRSGVCRRERAGAMTLLI